MDIIFNEKMLAYCGLYCEQCSFKLAHDENNISHLNNIPYKAALRDLSAYNCGGCKSDNCICGICKIKPCAVMKNIESCADCDNFPCEHIKAFENDGIPHHKMAVENLQYIKRNGFDNWFKNLKPSLRCEKCGVRQSWYYTCMKHKRLQCIMADNISIRVITENKKDFLPLLLLGDESESYIEAYLKRGELFALYENGLETVSGLKAVCVVTDEGGGILEIQNLATDERYRRQGYALRLVDHIAQYYKNRYDKIILGTGDVPGILAFYNRCGFTITHRVPDYFTTHYDHPMIEEGILLKDKIYLEMSL